VIVRRSATSSTRCSKRLAASVIAVPEMFPDRRQHPRATYRTFEVYLGFSVYYLVLTAI